MYWIATNCCSSTFVCYHALDTSSTLAASLLFYHSVLFLSIDGNILSSFAFDTSSSKASSKMEKNRHDTNPPSPLSLFPDKENELFHRDDLVRTPRPRRGVLRLFEDVTT
mmetsp:Transcript_13909/g.33345  ORF Transcript_13909/g.33345 Transcript_13909/m.33345 type:complete len:110 (-) Transcript_13909:656-985(-)